ncbi:MAG: acyl-CoA dehydrogenase family protein [Porticoccaceae bacterium]|nr:acyl-CoA dehydrogenase family protein [Porticoccaceae bacterium]
MSHNSQNIVEAMAGAKLSADPALQAFRNEVRQFCRANLPQDIRRKVILNQHLDKQDYVRWQKILAAKGWMAGHWPEQYGGCNWSRVQRWVFEWEIYRAGAPWLMPFGVTYVCPVIYTFGSEAQRKKYLTPTLNTDIWWAQGYSEPDAGSDLAKVKTRAVRAGDHYIVNGQKTWTTMAHWADMMFALVRTSTENKPQQGISFLLIDLHSPGITVRPIETIDGGHHVNEVFLENVQVPVENLVGDEGAGWTYAKFLLGNERLLAADVGKAIRLFSQLQGLLEVTHKRGKPLLADAVWQSRLADLEVRILSLQALGFELMAQAESGSEPGPEASVLKIVGTELMQDIAAHSIELLAHHGLAFQAEALAPGWDGELTGPSFAPGAISEYLHGRASTIYGGSSEIQRNILAKAVLEL